MNIHNTLNIYNSICMKRLKTKIPIEMEFIGKQITRGDRELRELKRENIIHA